jgi:hypothetical protein
MGTPRGWIGHTKSTFSLELPLRREDPEVPQLANEADDSPDDDSPGEDECAEANADDDDL